CRRLVRLAPGLVELRQLLRGPLRPGMVRADRLLARGAPLQDERLGLVEALFRSEDRAQPDAQVGGARVVFAQLADGEREAFARRLLRGREVPLGLVKSREVVERYGDVGMIGAERLLQAVDRVAVGGLRGRVLAGLGVD